jgi:DNA-directed RNA polymerase subunit RPC12/RpoP
MGTTGKQAHICYDCKKKLFFFPGELMGSKKIRCPWCGCGFFEPLKPAEETNAAINVEYMSRMESGGSVLKRKGRRRIKHT